jgi:hypothetical protein
MLSEADIVLLRGWRQEDLKVALEDIMDCSVTNVVKRLNDQQLARIADSGIFPNEPISLRGLKITKFREHIVDELRQHATLRSRDPERVVLKIEAAMGIGAQQ